ncbi:hypothetical protein BZA77DRAFT_315222 [Pyronema omphalodes]|nr:hypothetical protein BZA77DRAFT_315222 [Pyronema omphalodes]
MVGSSRRTVSWWWWWWWWWWWCIVRDVVVDSSGFVDVAVWLARLACLGFGPFFRCWISLGVLRSPQVDSSSSGTFGRVQLSLTVLEVVLVVT